MASGVIRQRTQPQEWLAGVGKKGLAFCFMLLLAAVFVLPPAAHARDARKKQKTRKVAPAAESATYTSALLIELESGTVLFEKDSRLSWTPASMVKMMTTLIVLEHIREGKLNFNDKVTVSEWAARIGGSQVYLAAGETFTVEDLLKAVMIHSANDAAAALAEYTAGSIEGFVDLMNDKAVAMGLKDTYYSTVHGLPPEPGQKEDRTNAWDLAMLGRELLKFPQAAEWASTTEAPFRDGRFILHSPNQLLRRYRGADGIKTGHHNKAGYCVTASAKRGDLRLIAVILGAPTAAARLVNASQLLNQGFAEYRMLVPVKEGEKLGQDAPVRGGEVDTVPLVASGDVRVLVKRGEEKKVEIKINAIDRVPAPIKAGQIMGDVIVTLDGTEVGRTSATAAHEIALGSLWKRWWPF